MWHCAGSFSPENLQLAHRHKKHTLVRLQLTAALFSSVEHIIGAHGEKSYEYLLLPGVLSGIPFTLHVNKRKNGAQ